MQKENKSDKTIVVAVQIIKYKQMIINKMNKIMKIKMFFIHKAVKKLFNKYNQNQLKIKCQINYQLIV